jgi:hypothetical protein
MNAGYAVSMNMQEAKTNKVQFAKIVRRQDMKEPHANDKKKA